MAEEGRSVRKLCHNVDKMNVAWARVLAVEVVRSGWNSGDILKVG